MARCVPGLSLCAQLSRLVNTAACSGSKRIRETIVDCVTLTLLHSLTSLVLFYYLFAHYSQSRSEGCRSWKVQVWFETQQDFSDAYILECVLRKSYTIFFFFLNNSKWQCVFKKLMWGGGGGGDLKFSHTERQEIQEIHIKQLEALKRITTDGLSLVRVALRVVTS